MDGLGAVYNVEDIMSLSGREETYCQLVSLGTMSDTEAYRRAGYSPKSANANSVRLRAKESIQTRIAQLKAELAEIAGMDRERFIKLSMEHRVIALAKDDVNAANGALSLVGKACALLTDKLITEQSEEQKELTALQEKEAKRMAQVMLRVHRSGQDGQEEQKAG